MKKAKLNELIRLRHKLHASPEVSGNERKTARSVLKYLKSCNPAEIITDVGGHGILATWDSGREGPELWFRSELDALPIHEINNFKYKSKYDGVGHKCGHDGHTAILCGLAGRLDDKGPSMGRVRLLFQPAEENGKGAEAMLNDPKFSDLKPDFIFALHNLPGYPLHEVVIKEDTFTASVNSIIIHLQGKTAHAAEPEHGYNPAMAMGEIISQSLKLSNNIPERDDMKVITPVFMEMGEKAYGISAGSGEVHLTLRCWSDELLRQLEKSIELLATQIAEAHQLKVWFEYTQTFHANVNDREAVKLIRHSAQELNLPLVERSYPFKWGEDFGLFTSRFRGCMFGLGAGTNTPALHNPDYDFPDELIETGVNLFYNVVHETVIEGAEYV
jgi:amidohydrolase